MKVAVLCILVVFTVGLSKSEEHGGKSLLNTLGFVPNAQMNVAGFAPGHEGHHHGSSGRAGCRGSTTAAPTTARTTAAG